MTYEVWLTRGEGSDLELISTHSDIYEADRSASLATAFSPAGESAEIRKIATTGVRETGRGR